MCVCVPNEYYYCTCIVFSSNDFLSNLKDNLSHCIYGDLGLHNSLKLTVSTEVACVLVAIYNQN